MREENGNSQGDFEEGMRKKQLWEAIIWEHEPSYRGGMISGRKGKQYLETFYRKKITQSKDSDKLVTEAFTHSDKVVTEAFTHESSHDQSNSID